MVMAEMENNDYYNKSLKALIEYIEQEKKTITEVEWNRYAFKNNYLSSETMGYLSKTKFHKLCKSILKEIKKRKLKAKIVLQVHDEMMIESPIEEAEKVKVRLEKLNSEIYNKKEVIELDKTGIENIDDMLKYMQIECIKNKIDFTLKITGNIYYMINNLINKEDLETLLADHIKDAIIAINHTENINKSILVRLGDIDGNYGLYIYDSGVEFPKEVLENLGKKPCTTYKNEGGTGMGFMNTFDTLRKCNASLIIEELNEPKEDNYTKIVEIKFDKKNEFKVNSYKNKNR